MEGHCLLKVSFPRMRESTNPEKTWTPAFAGVTFNSKRRQQLRNLDSRTRGGDGRMRRWRGRSEGGLPHARG